MNPRQRRGLVFVALAVAGAIVAVVLIANYTSSVRADVGPPTEVLALTEDVAAYSPIEPYMVEAIEVPEKWRPATAFTYYDEIVGLQAAADLVAGSILQPGMVQPPPDLEAGQREIAIEVDAEAGVAGKIGRGSIVEIYATYTDETDTPRSEIIVSQALVLEVGVATDDIPDSDGELAEGRVVPVTFALSVADSLRVIYAATFAQQIRLGLIGEGDTEPVPQEDRIYTPGSGDGEGV